MVEAWISICGSVKKGILGMRQEPMVKHSTWCPKCAIIRNVDKKRSNIEEYRKLAVKNGGVLLSDKYINSSTKMKWPCRHGHIWSTTGMVFKTGHLCPVCRREHGDELRRISLGPLIKIARKHGGKLLYRSIEKTKSILHLQCREGHEWKPLLTGSRKVNGVPGALAVAAIRWISLKKWRLSAVASAFQKTIQTRERS